MSLEIVSLDIVANTTDGRYGVTIPFSSGLFLLRMENSHGKSTCMNAIAYALGMEKALGMGGAKIPFPPSLTRVLNTIDGQEINVISSFVTLK
ncbi:TPA: ATP-binding protein, partial [Salmonella enterica subsp. enterica serovar Kottbus]